MKICKTEPSINNNEAERPDPTSSLCPADKACTDSQSLSSLFVSGSNNEINHPAATLQQRCSLQYNDHALPSLIAGEQNETNFSGPSEKCGSVSG